MPRKKSQAQLDAITSKNQQTQCNFYVVFKEDVGVQTYETSASELKSKGLVKVSAEIQTDFGLNIRNVETQTEIFGFNVPSQKWEEINCFNSLNLVENSRKRKLYLDKETCTADDSFGPKRRRALSISTEATAFDTTFNELELISPAILALKTFTESLSQGASIRILKDHNGLVEYLEIYQENGLLAVANYYDAPRRLLFSCDGTLSILTLFKGVEQIKYYNFETQTLNVEIVTNAMASLDKKYVFCTGIRKDEAMGMECTKKLQKHVYPFERYQATDCFVWFVPPPNAAKEKIRERLYQCTNCRSLNWYMTDCKKKKEQVTPRSKLKRQSVDSRCRITILTPKSKRKRLLQSKRKRSSLVRKVKDLESKLIATSLELNQEHDGEMKKIVAEINMKGRNDLDQIFSEAMKKNKTIGLALRKAWELNSQPSTKNDFLNDQEKCRKGSQGNRWSPLTYRIALSVYSRSPAAYEALASFDVLQLPSTHTLKAKVRQIESKPGIDLVHLKKESKRFDEFVGDHPEYYNPVKEGALIFDEVKIIGKLMWNSTNGEFMGAAMDPNEYASLEDLYKVRNLSEVLEAEYALQYLWRCTTTSFDIIGPYFMFSKPVTHAAITSTLLKTVFAFHSVGLEVGVFVCDGGSSNISSLRQSLGISKALEPSANEDGSLNFRFSTKIRNWCVQERWIYWMVCPSHQLKNMINALNHSQDEGTRDFTKQGVRFGWKQIAEMKKREDDRRDSGELVQVKRLLQSHIDRDSWTKLNVTPARILQQMEVMGELYNYANPTFEDVPNDRENVMACYDFLKACHDIFEEGLLSKERVYSLESPPIRSMLNGLKYFENWAIERMTDSKKMTNNPKFLAWQTFELLRISIYGFIDYLQDFTTRHPSKYIYPLRLNGSAVETLFSQMKYVTAGKLTSLNYSNARRALLIKGCTKTSQNAEASYRKVGLDICEK